MNKKIMKNEALRRMKNFGIMKETVRDFEDGVLSLSERGGFLYWLDNDQKKKVEEWEKRTGNICYHVVRDFTNVGEMLTLLYVGKYKEDWKFEDAEITNNCPTCYVINVDIPEFSEYGSCKIVPSIGGLRRVF